MILNNEPSTAPLAALPAQQRLLALDVFRGLTLAGMVLVNSHGDPRLRYGPLHHAAWHGWTFADLIFPFFVFIVGVAIPFIDGRRARGTGRGRIVLRTLRRAGLLFAIGVAMNWYHSFDLADSVLDLANLRLMNVLQRIALCAVAVTVLDLWCRPRTQALLAGTILVLYFVLMTCVPVPGYGPGVLDRAGNWAQYIDAHVLGAHCGSSYQGQYYEGKGLLATLPAIVTALMGLWTGRYLRSARPDAEKLVNLYFLGTAAMFLGAFWDNFFPVNQCLWTSSLVLLMGGMAMVVLASCYYAADVRKVTWWTPPLVVLGTNSLAVWVGSITLRDTLDKFWLDAGGAAPISVKTYFFQNLARWLGPANGSLAFAVLYLLLWIVVMADLYRRKVFFRV